MKTTQIQRVSIRTAVLVASVVAAGTETPYGYAASFDCTKASTSVEKLICNVPRLSELDDRLASQYKTAAATSTNREALKTEQRLWLKEQRNLCKDEACLVRVYEGRLTVLAESQPKSSVALNWVGKWERTDGNQFGGATLEITSVGDMSLEFSVTVQGEIKEGSRGGTAKIQGNHADYVGEIEEGYTDPCSVSLRLVNDTVTVGMRNCVLASGADSGDVGSADGTYKKDYVRKTRSLSESGLLANDKEEQEFKKLVGADYQNFLMATDSVTDAIDLDQIGATVRKGNTMARECIVMITRDGKFMAAVPFGDTPMGEGVRYHSNNPLFIKTLPKTIDEWHKGGYPDELPLVGVVVPAPAPVQTSIPTMSTTTATVESSFKVKGLFIGMNIKSVAAILKQKLPEGRGFEVLDAIAERQSVMITHGVEGIVGMVQASPEGDVAGIVIGGGALDAMFSAAGMEASDFVQEFVNAYHIPEMKIGDDMKSWIYSSPEGYRVEITTSKILSILKIPSASERRKSFD